MSLFFNIVTFYHLSHMSDSERISPRCGKNPTSYVYQNSAFCGVLFIFSNKKIWTRAFFVTLTKYPCSFYTAYILYHRANDVHLSAKNVKQSRKFIKSRFAPKSNDLGNSLFGVLNLCHKASYLITAKKTKKSIKTDFIIHIISHKHEFVNHFEQRKQAYLVFL